MNSVRGRGRGVTISASPYPGSSPPPAVQSNVLRGLGRGCVGGQTDSVPYSGSSTTGTDNDDTSGSSGHSGMLPMNARHPFPPQLRKPLPVADGDGRNGRPHNMPRHAMDSYKESDDPGKMRSGHASIPMGRGEAVQYGSMRFDSDSSNSASDRPGLTGKTSLTRNAQGPSIVIEKKSPQAQSYTGGGEREQHPVRHQRQSLSHAQFRVSPVQSSKESKNDSGQQHQTSSMNQLQDPSQNAQGGAPPQSSTESDTNSSVGTCSSKEPSIQAGIQHQPTRQQHHTSSMNQWQVLSQNTQGRSPPQTNKERQSDTSSSIGTWSSKEPSVQPAIQNQHKRQQYQSSSMNQCQGLSYNAPERVPPIQSGKESQSDTNSSVGTWSSKEPSIQAGMQDQPRRPQYQTSSMNQGLSYNDPGRGPPVQSDQPTRQTMDQWQNSMYNAQGQAFKIGKETHVRCSTENHIIAASVQPEKSHPRPQNQISPPQNQWQADMNPSKMVSHTDYEYLICDDLGGAGFGMDMPSERDTPQQQHNIASPHQPQQHMGQQPFPSNIQARQSQQKYPANQDLATLPSNLPPDWMRHRQDKSHILSRQSPQKDPANREQNTSPSNLPNKTDATFKDSTGRIWMAPSSEQDSHQKPRRNHPGQGNWRSHQGQGGSNWGGHQDQSSGNWRGQQNQSPGNWRSQPSPRNKDQRQENWRSASNQRPVNRINQPDQRSGTSTPAAALTTEQKKNEFEWQRFKVIRKVKKALSDEKFDDIKCKAKEISDILDSETPRLAPFPAAWPKERHVALEEILNKAIQDEDFQPIAGHLMKEIYELKPERYKEILIEVLKKKEPEYVKVSTATNSGKVRASYCAYLCSVSSASVSASEDGKFKAVVEDVIIRLIQRWLYFDIKGEHMEMDEYLTVLASCLATLVKLLLPHLDNDQRRKIFNLIKDKALSNGQRNMKLKMLALLLQWSSDWKEDLFYTSYLDDPDTSMPFMKEAKVPNTSAADSSTNKDAAGSVAIADGNDVGTSGNDVSTSGNDVVTSSNDVITSSNDVITSSNDVVTNSSDVGSSTEASVQKSEEYVDNPGAITIEPSSTASSANWWEEDDVVKEIKDKPDETQDTTSASPASWWQEEPVKVDASKHTADWNTQEPKEKSLSAKEEAAVEPIRSQIDLRATISWTSSLLGKGFRKLVDTYQSSKKTNLECRDPREDSQLDLGSSVDRAAEGAKVVEDPDRMTLSRISVDTNKDFSIMITSQKSGDVHVKSDFPNTDDMHVRSNDLDRSILSQDSDDSNDSKDLTTAITTQKSDDATNDDKDLISPVITYQKSDVHIKSDDDRDKRRSNEPVTAIVDEEVSGGVVIPPKSDDASDSESDVNLQEGKLRYVESLSSCSGLSSPASHICRSGDDTRSVTPESLPELVICGNVRVDDQQTISQSMQPTLEPNIEARDPLSEAERDGKLRYVEGPTTRSAFSSRRSNHASHICRSGDNTRSVTPESLPELVTCANVSVDDQQINSESTQATQQKIDATDSLSETVSESSEIGEYSGDVEMSEEDNRTRNKKEKWRPFVPYNNESLSLSLTSESDDAASVHSSTRPLPVKRCYICRSNEHSTKECGINQIMTDKINEKLKEAEVELQGGTLPQ